MPGCCPRELWGGECRQGRVGGSLQTLEVSILGHLCLQCQIFLLSLPSVGMRQGLLWHANRLELKEYPSWESLLSCYQSAHRTVRPPRLRGLKLVYMMVVLRGLPEIRVETSLLERGVQLMTLPTTSFRTTNATPSCRFESSLQCQILCPRPWYFLQTLSI